MRKWEKEEHESRPKREPIKKLTEKQEQYLRNLQMLEVLAEEHEKGTI